MPTAAKVAQVAELEDRIGRCVIAIGLDYRGLTVGELRRLRLALREVEPSMELRVVKNRLLARAAQNAGRPELAGIVQETTALLFGYQEVVSPAKALTTYLRQNRLQIPIRGGYMEGALLSPAEIEELARTPGRTELMGQIAGSINQVVGGVAGVLAAALREIAAVVEARAAQLDDQGTTAEDSATAADNPAGE